MTSFSIFIQHEKIQEKKVIFNRPTHENIMENEHLLQKSKCSISHNIFTYMIFQRRQRALLWSRPKWLKWFKITPFAMTVIIVRNFT